MVKILLLAVTHTHIHIINYCNLHTHSLLLNTCHSHCARGESIHHRPTFQRTSQLPTHCEVVSDNSSQYGALFLVNKNLTVSEHVVTIFSCRYSYILLYTVYTYCLVLMAFLQHIHCQVRLCCHWLVRDRKKRTFQKFEESGLHV